ncbi:EMI1 family protein, partial [Aspergillus glaucus CBS 516.65]
MGWWWSSSPQKDESSSPAATPAPDAAQSRTLTRDEDELKKLFAAFESSNANNNNATSPKSLDPSSSTPTTDSFANQQPQPPSIAPESLYQDTMSCRSAFDYAFFCQSFGGQFVNVYRYGELRSCSEHWDNFWLCMRTRSWGENERRKAIRDHNRKKAIKYKTGPSSEDVWDMRTQPVQNVFQGDFAALEKEMQAEEEAGGAGARV